MQEVTATTGGPGTVQSLHACRLVESLCRGRHGRAGRELKGPEVKNKQSQGSGTVLPSAHGLCRQATLPRVLPRLQVHFSQTN